MTPKLDQDYALLLRRAARVSSDGIENLISEVERLEYDFKRIERMIDPNMSPGGDIVWLVQNALKNLNDEIARLKKKCGET